MAFTRNFLKSINLSDEQITAVMEEHTNVTDALKKQRDDYKAEAEKLPDIQKQLDDLKGGEDWKKKFEDEHNAFEGFKKKTADDAEAAKVRAAYRKLLAEEKIGDKRLDAVLRLTDFSGMKLGEDGTLQNADALRENVRKEWSDYIQTEETKGAKVDTPPHISGPKMTREQIFAIKNTADRQKAIAENPQLFQ